MQFRFALVLALATLSRTALAQDASEPGTPSSPYPTLHNLSIVWPLVGDDNENARVEVRYRRRGEESFREALPLFRVPSGINEGFEWANTLAGSIFGLEPGTAYEIQLALTDPDGGDTGAAFEVATRPEPAWPENANEVDVEPATLEAALDEAAPGDVLVLGEGTYAGFTVPNDGEPGRPIVVRGATDAVVAVDGDVRIDDRAHVFVEDLSVRGQIKFNDAESIVVRNCTIEANEDGIVSYGSGVDNAVITGNVVIGTTVWRDEALGVDGDNVGEGVVLTGAGNVVSFNRVVGFRDCLSMLEDAEASNQISNDFYGNDLSECADDAIEADFAMGNVRVYQNRITDSFMGLSSQPSLGGPTYFLRNVMYNVVFQAFKLQRASVGDIGLHNTVVKSGDAFSVNTDDVFSRAWFRNNLFIGGPGGDHGGYDSGPGEVIHLPSADESCSFDFDGYGSIGTGSFSGRIGEVDFTSLEQLQSTTSEANAVEVDLSAFDQDVAFPADPFAAPAAPGFTLAAEGAAVDRGARLPNVNDGFAGSAPDLGAIEHGESEIEYGPGGEVVNESPVDEPVGSGGSVVAEPEPEAMGGNGNRGGSGGEEQAPSGGTSAPGGADTGGSPASGGGADGDVQDAGATEEAGRPREPGETREPRSDAGRARDATEDGGCACRASGQPATSAGWLAAAALLLTRRRWNRRASLPPAQPARTLTPGTRGSALR